MQRLTITLDDDLMAALDGFMAARGYSNRSEALRDLARSGLQRLTEEEGGTEACVAALVYAYDPATRDLAARLAGHAAARADLQVARTSTPAGDGTLFEVAILKGRGRDLRRYAGTVLAERGVSHGRLVLAPAEDGFDALGRLVRAAPAAE